ncbi:MAG: stage II sporulation protein P [Bacilli bacterium]|nr:stage II sporulation protein P [Bacilli bacterium]
MHKRRRKLRFTFLALIFIYSVFLSFQYLENKKIEIKDKTLVKLFLYDSFHIKDKDDYMKKAFNVLVRINSSYDNLVEPKKLVQKKVKTKEIREPLVYIYNTHQKEEYLSNQFNEYSIKPTVMMPSYIMEEVLNSKNIYTIVEENSINEILKRNNWNYAGSYKASRILIEEAKKKNPSLKYFVDVHRDSVKHDKTTVTINNKAFAKLLFIIGLENPHYEDNLLFTNKINEKINKYYPGLSRGIYKKKGIGVNGVYNQDNNKYTILIEVGGKENTIDEVMNATIAFIKCFEEVVKDEG